MAQRLGERARVPAEATGLYRAVLLRSGKWEQGPLPRLEEREEGLLSAPTSAPPARHGALVLPCSASLLPFPFLLSSLSLFLIIFFLPLSFLSFLLSLLHSSLWGFVRLCVGARAHAPSLAHSVLTTKVLRSSSLGGSRKQRRAPGAGVRGVGAQTVGKAATRAWGQEEREPTGVQRVLGERGR